MKHPDVDPRERDLSGAVWRKASASGGENNCVEVADLPGGARAVRDSKNPEGPALVVGPGAWAGFLGGVTG
ncbi:DUF397 domain-containing protein [Streptomyces sp. G5(2025)]|uniref:DUF397 domain-containing protein n=1 Tax=Streptomyces sp. G5(2025) TaxID=3406628 RepID=UPI003C1AFA46